MTPTHCRPALVLELQALSKQIRELADCVNTTGPSTTFTLGVEFGLAIAAQMTQNRAYKVGGPTTFVKVSEGDASSTD